MENVVASLELRDGRTYRENVAGLIEVVDFLRSLLMPAVILLVQSFALYTLQSLNCINVVFTPLYMLRRRNYSTNGAIPQDLISAGVKMKFLTAAVGNALLRTTRAN